MNAVFSPQCWEDYQYWSQTDRSVLRRINSLIEIAKYDPAGGVGKPERLVHELDGCWSRRITGEHRLVYMTRETGVVFVQARYHYS